MGHPSCTSPRSGTWTDATSAPRSPFRTCHQAGTPCAFSSSKRAATASPHRNTSPFGDSNGWREGVRAFTHTPAMKDISRYLRLQGAIRAAIDAVPEGQAALAGHAMMNAYRRFRSEARANIPNEQFSEFDAMFPTEVIFERANPRDDLQDAAAEFNAARLQLSTMAGWLDGFCSGSQDADGSERLREGSREGRTGCRLLGPSCVQRLAHPVSEGRHQVSVTIHRERRGRVTGSPGHVQRWHAFGQQIADPCVAQVVESHVWHPKPFGQTGEVQR